MSTSKTRGETGGLHSTLEVCIGAKVMVVYNIDSGGGLVNGVIGTVKGHAINNQGKISQIMVKFDNNTVRKKSIATS